MIREQSLNGGFEHRAWIGVWPSGYFDLGIVAGVVPGIDGTGKDGHQTYCNINVQKAAGIGLFEKAIARIGSGKEITRLWDRWVRDDWGEDQQYDVFLEQKQLGSARMQLELLRELTDSDVIFALNKYTLKNGILIRHGIFRS